ncbi:MAG TPA: EAL domain-containing protein, partial [Gammaproteobacteria bacterium]|nr:EAL domain-containing protein [Gammaproteobacteria bacterium]
KYNKIYQHFSNKKSHKYQDEVSLLEETILQVAKQLQSLQNEVDERTKSLVKQTHTLERERNFIQGLLDTAPLIILTQDKNGKIITINRFGKKHIEDGNENLIYENVFIADNNQKQHILELLDRLRSSQTGKIRFDSTLDYHNDRSRHITWFHTKLSDNHPDAPLILSIGLDITDRKVAENRLAWLANHDPLTHLCNRRSFQDQFSNLIDIAHRQKQSVALLYFDLDQFKYINDTCGHKAGDVLLQVIADKLREVTRSSDILARLGGDEFALVIYGISEDGAVKVAEKIFSSLQSIDYRIEDNPFKITVSIGIALFPKHGHSIQELLANADLAMYQAKEAGRGRIHVYSPDAEFHKRIHHELYWKDQIQQAMDENRFVLYFQPILNLRTRTISHYESLLRMLDKNGKILSPDQFIPVAERVGLIRSIDKLVVDKALDIHKSLLSKGYDIVLSINLSGQALADEDLQNYIYDSLANPQVKPELIIFEITETIAVSNFASARHLMERIRSLGCSFALDDFGVGFSSFYYLMHLPVDYVKIDGSFIKKLENSQEDQVLVQALAEIAQRLGKETIAEFVENAKILDLLEKYGIHYAQGYHVGRPMPQILFSKGIGDSRRTI